MAPIFLLILISCLPNSPLANALHSFKRLQLPSPGCEAYAFDSDNGGPYTGLNDGRIVKYQGPNAGFVEYATTSKELCDGTHGDMRIGRICGRPLDMEFNHKTGELYVVDLFRGLMVVAPGGGVAAPVASGDGMPVDGPDAIAIDPMTDEVYFTDIGTIIFTNTGDTSGRLLKYDQKIKLRTVVLTGIAGPAGVAVSHDGSFVLIAEYLGCQITRLWLKGPKARTKEVITHLPGNPDSIKRTKSGDFWVSVNIQKLHPKLTSFPLGQKINQDGRITETVNSFTEYNATYVTEVHEHLGSLYVASLAVSLPKSSAKIAVFDEYLQKQANESYAESLKAFNPHPEDLTDEFNELATNPIDRCWRCDRNWAKNRKKLADCARGFGHETFGGKNGKYYLVTDASDDSVDNPRPGTLRHAVIQSKPLWIVFSHSMVIKLRQELIMTSDKTIDGRGVQVHIAYGAGITIQFVRNIIIHNVWIHDIVVASGGMIRDSVGHVGLRTQSDGDAISIYGSSRVWIDHVSLSKGADGLIDVMLLGAHDTDAKDAIMQVTIAFNRFGIGCIQRMPRVRWGFAHVVNNDYSHWKLYAIGGSAHPTIISQGNRFKADDFQYKEVTKRDYATPEEWKRWQWRSEGDLFTNGAFFTESGAPLEHKKSPLTHRNLIKFKPGSYVGRLTRSAGAIKCKKNMHEAKMH
ncbi:pectin lyase-like superfamily protein, partial [Striga asiatica]